MEGSTRTFFPPYLHVPTPSIYPQIQKLPLCASISTENRDGVCD